MSASPKNLIANLGSVMSTRLHSESESIKKERAFEAYLEGYEWIENLQDNDAQEILKKIQDVIRDNDLTLMHKYLEIKAICEEVSDYHATIYTEENWEQY
jgi:hypothetical protein